MSAAKWSVAVTTVPERRATLLPQTLAGLKAAGFRLDRLFIDGDADGKGWESEFGVPATARGGDPMRVSGNWVAAAHEMYQRDSGRDYYLIVQDDVLFLRDVRLYLEACELPGDSYFNLFTYRRNQEVIHGRRIGWLESAELPHDRGNERPGNTWQQTGDGALALLFPNQAMEALLCSPHLTLRRRDGQGWRSIDGGIVEALNRAGFRERVHNPTLCKHLGAESTILLPRKGADGAEVYERKQRAPNTLTFMGENFSALRFLEAKL